MPDLAGEKATSFGEFESEMLARPGIRREYDALSPRYDMIRNLIKRRTQRTPSISKFP